MSELRTAAGLPGTVHRLVAADFLRGEFGSAVFKAFKEVEIRVRVAAGFPQDLVGVTLARKAFHAQTGPLRDESLPEGERDSMMHLFASAIGLFKNPESHRDVERGRDEALQLLGFADRLLAMIPQTSGS